jgi:DNA helicase-2/ATP-dependent DNA helicase PcrA
VVNVPPRGIGARSIEQVQELAKRYNSSMYSAAATGISKGEISGRAASSVGAFLRVVEALKASSTVVSLQELAEECLEKSGLRSHYQAEREGADRLENLAELVTATAQFQEEYEGEDTSLVGFLTHASLEAGEHEAGANEDALQLMTVHSAKGLEFKAVFLGGLEEGLFPHENSITDLDGIEEERRLMYVAVTRARERLYLSYASQRMLHGQTRYGIVSRFVEEIPAGLCKWILVPERQAGYLAGQQLYPSARGASGGNVQQAWGGYMGNRGIRYGEADPKYGREGAPDTSRANFETVRPDAHPFAVGQNVAHAKFGEGVVLNYEGRGLDARVQVKFRDEGTKWLALQYARLTAA